MQYNVRKAIYADLEDILRIYALARAFMAQTGNPNQWGNHHPPRTMLIEDIQDGNLYVLENETGIHGVFAFLLGEDPTYRTIYKGRWRSEQPYGTIHRIAGDGSGGILATCVKHCLCIIPHLRIDTHHHNVVMQNAIQKQGFQKCGIIYLQDGSPRIAYDKIN